MRDNHEGLPEFIDALERDGHYFGVVELNKEGVAKRLQFGVSLAGYRAIKRQLT